MIAQTIAVAAGGAVGAVVRFLISQRINRGFPWGTLAVNVAGSLLLGWYVADEGDSLLSSLYATGFLGALTTFSTLQFEAVTILKSNAKRGLTYLFLTYILGLLAAWTGFVIGIK
ncbi:fluoride efflux transporter FluC [Fictibacillus norfolkensis]|jgi:fluoride exporter|uniref:Fluoride-specific ion channel FluC n=1 Tax=Fictibacillus norfolkensis TaxID=2762233 RepID=A0ABR8SIG8_9BACL|nr:CrcB family protein [Fictibacillus norfolkensis]MBD7963281.1 CrcB family protein [Fictibacillus norfolkensis]